MLYKDFTSLGEFRMANLSIVRAMKIPLPPLSIQQQIVAKIKSYQTIINGAKQVVQNYKPQIDIDPDWEMVELAEVCEMIQYGSSAPLNLDSNGYKTFRMNEIIEGIMVDNGSMKYSDLNQADFKKYKLEKGDILFNRTNSYELVGKTGIFNLHGDYAFASYLIRLKVLKSKAYPFYINLYMNTFEFQDGIKQFASRAIGQSNINAKSLSSYVVPIPPLSIQQLIIPRIEHEQQLVNANKDLIKIYEQKIKDEINKLWQPAAKEYEVQEEKLTVAAEE